MSRILQRVTGGPGPGPVRPRLPHPFEPGLDLWPATSNPYPERLRQSSPPHPRLPAGRPVDGDAALDLSGDTAAAGAPGRVALAANVARESDASRDNDAALAGDIGLTAN